MKSPTLIAEILDAPVDQLHVVQTIIAQVPSVEVPINTGEIQLPGGIIAGRDGSVYNYTISTSISGLITVENTTSVNPITFDKEGFKIKAKNETADFFSEISIQNPNDIFNSSPSITIGNKNENYSISLTAHSISENLQMYDGSVNKEISSVAGNLKLTGTISINISITLSKNNSNDSYTWMTSLVQDLETTLSKTLIVVGLAGVIIICFPELLAGITIGGVTWAVANA